VAVAPHFLNNYVYLKAAAGESRSGFFSWRRIIGGQRCRFKKTKIVRLTGGSLPRVLPV
jgi:hypothetical protein